MFLYKMNYIVFISIILILSFSNNISLKINDPNGILTAIIDQNQNLSDNTLPVIRAVAAPPRKYADNVKIHVDDAQALLRSSKLYTLTENYLTYSLSNYFTKRSIRNKIKEKYCKNLLLSTGGWYISNDILTYVCDLSKKTVKKLRNKVSTNLQRDQNDPDYLNANYKYVSLIDCIVDGLRSYSISDRICDNIRGEFPALFAAVKDTYPFNQISALIVKIKDTIISLRHDTKQKINYNLDELVSANFYLFDSYDYLKLITLDAYRHIYKIRKLDNIPLQLKENVEYNDDIATGDDVQRLNNLNIPY